MSDAVRLCVTTDRARIKAWAERRHARPSREKGSSRAWPIALGSGPLDPASVEIGWDEFFAEFDNAQLAFAYRDEAPDGRLDDLHEFVRRSEIPELAAGRTMVVIEHIV